MTKKSPHPVSDNNRQLDITFDFQTDTPKNKDPDKYSPKLRQYHKVLWSKVLPNGELFELDDTKAGAYLYHCSKLGEFWLASDSVIPTFRKETRISHFLIQIPEELDSFLRIGYTIGDMMLFPGNRINRKMTINGLRGFHPRIKDRFDLTVECIRKHYLKEESPLSETLNRYSDFFRLFDDFRGYIEFFLLQDLVNDDFTAVNFFSPFEGFISYPIPDSLPAYLDYRKRAIEFIEARNQRMLSWWEKNVEKTQLKLAAIN